MTMPTITFQPYAPGLSVGDGSRAGSIDPRLSRTNYFDGQLLKASDLTRDQIYLDERLLEMGQVLGSGIARGLDVSLVDGHILRVQPGLAITPSGRVLQLTEKSLEINLQDSGVIADLNQGLYRRFHRGLYAVALRYAEVVDGVSESYPSDLSSRQWRVSSYAEGVELALIPLELTLPRGDALAIRAALAQQIIGLGAQVNLPTDEAIALGLIAIDQARPLWLDHGLLRRPLRQPNMGNAVQLDLATHYEELFGDVLAARAAGGRPDDFAASNYFRLLPPYGPLPMGSIDPVSGRQSYFPKDYDVTIAPVRRADLASIVAESAHLAPMDLERDADADIMVLVPMSDPTFALRGRQLEQTQGQKELKVSSLRSFGGLSLRFNPLPPVHHTDTDIDTWRAIWKEASQKNELVYVRRPPRAAETNVSAIMLARGVKLPDFTEYLPVSSADLESQLDEALEAGAALETELSQSAKEVKALTQQVDTLKKIIDNDMELVAAQDQINALTSDIAAATAELAKLQEQALDAATFKIALAASSEKITMITAELEAAHQKIAELESRIASDEADQKKLRELMIAVDTANNEIKRLTQSYEAMTVRLAESGAALVRADARIGDLQAQLDSLNTVDTARSDALLAAQAQVDSLKAQVDTLSRLNKALQSDLGLARTAQLKAEQDSRDLTARLTTAVTQNQDLQAQCTSLQSDLKSCSAARDVAQATITELQLQLGGTIVLPRIFPFVPFAVMRGGDSTAAKQLEEQVGSFDEARSAIIQLLAITPVDYEKALWQFLVTIGRKPAAIPEILAQLFKAVQSGMDLVSAYRETAKQYGIPLAAPLG